VRADRIRSGAASEEHELLHRAAQRLPKLASAIAVQTHRRDQDRGDEPELMALSVIFGEHLPLEIWYNHQLIKLILPKYPYPQNRRYLFLNVDI
jgi:hypothetical protein